MKYIINGKKVSQKEFLENKAYSSIKNAVLKIVSEKEIEKGKKAKSVTYLNGELNIEF